MVSKTLGVTAADLIHSLDERAFQCFIGIQMRNGEKCSSYRKLVTEENTDHKDLWT